MSSLRNVVLSTLRRYRTAGIVNQSAADKTARSALARLRTHGRLEQTVLSLSGGNQQKVLFARIIEQNARIVMLDEPTKGVDVGAKSDIYAIVRHLLYRARWWRIIEAASFCKLNLFKITDRLPLRQVKRTDRSYPKRRVWAADGFRCNL